MYIIYYIIITDINTQNPQIWMKSTLRRKPKIIVERPVYYAFYMQAVGTAMVIIILTTNSCTIHVTVIAIYHFRSVKIAYIIKKQE